MSVVKLENQHKQAVRALFNHNKYMGLPVTEEINNMLYHRFCETYLFGLNNFHAFGYYDGMEVKSLISFYESDEEPAWYYTLYRSSGDKNLLAQVLDKVIDYNESNGRLKFYTLTHSNHTRLLRKFHWSDYNNERYGYFDECLVPAKTKSFYTNHWELLFKRTLLPEDSIVRCNFLKQEYRKNLPLGGGL